VNNCVENGGDETESGDVSYTTGGKGLRDAGKTLCRLIDKDKVSNSKNGPRRPLVIFSFDEADILTDDLPDEQGWNLFSDLRRVLRKINRLQIFSLFLSTAGRFHKFSPDVHHEISTRDKHPNNRPLDPIVEVSFDDIAYSAPMDTVKIDRVVGIDWMSHLGRPL
jgi:hypothetical protein